MHPGKGSVGPPLAQAKPPWRRSAPTSRRNEAARYGGGEKLRYCLDSQVSGRPRRDPGWTRFAEVSALDMVCRDADDPISADGMELSLLGQAKARRKWGMTTPVVRRS